MSLILKSEVLKRVQELTPSVRVTTATSGVSSLVAFAKLDWALLRAAMSRRCLGQALREFGDNTCLGEPPEPQRNVIGQTWSLADCLYFVDNVDHDGEAGVPTVEAWVRDYKVLHAELLGRTENGVPFLELIHQHRWPSIPYQPVEPASLTIGRKEIVAAVGGFRDAILKQAAETGMPLMVCLAASQWTYFTASCKRKMLAQVLNLLGERHEAEFPAPQTEIIRSWKLEHFKFFVDNVRYNGRCGIELSHTWLHRFELVSKIAGELEEVGITFLSSVRYHRWPDKLANPEEGITSVPPKARTADYYEPIMREMSKRYATWAAFAKAEVRLYRRVLAAGFNDIFYDYFTNPNEVRVIEWLHQQVAEGRTYRRFTDVLELGVPGLPHFRSCDVVRREVTRQMGAEGISEEEARRRVNPDDPKHDYLHAVRIACLLLGVVEQPRRMHAPMEGGYDAVRDESVRNLHEPHFALLLRLLRVKSHQDLVSRFPDLAEVIKIMRLRRALFAETIRELCSKETPTAVESA